MTPSARAAAAVEVALLDAALSSEHRARNVVRAIGEAGLVIVELPASGHEYLSTGCLHGEHGYCQSMTGLAGAKRPASCKFCAAQCVCPCHAEAAS